MGRHARVGRLAKVALATVAVVIVVAVANLPTTSQVMVDFVPRTVTQPLYAKAIAFIDRDIQMRLLAASVVGDARDDHDRVDRILTWTRQSIRPTPAGMAVVDDHPYHIIVRGYGEPDQAADVLANLAGYAGIPGGLVFSRAPDGSALYSFAVLEVDGSTEIVDVREGRILSDRDGRIRSVDQLKADPALLDWLPAPSAAHGVTYRVLIERLETAPHRSPSDQMPWSRLLREVRRIIDRR